MIVLFINFASIFEKHFYHFMMIFSGSVIDRCLPQLVFEACLDPLVNEELSHLQAFLSVFY